VITNVQLDHEKWLGQTVAEIAREKAGIIKPGAPVFTATIDWDVWNVLKETADRLQAPIHRAQITNDLPSSLQGPHQRANVALAVTVARSLPLPIQEGSLSKALNSVSWPGRFDIRGRYILDGAHNPAGALALRVSLETSFPGLKPTFIVGILADKDIAAMAREFVQVASRIYTVAVHSDRAADAEELARQFRSVAQGVPVQASPSLGEALKETENDDRTVVTGSLHFIGEAMERLGFGAGASNERGLNDWTKR
jgi:dihydrofolate synthase / folylpolyglutamate synthase